jgi:hypothetical protein
VIRRAVGIARHARLSLPVHARALAARRHYRVLDEDELRATRRSETVFVFGSGSSLNDIGPEEWASFAEHDTLGFNWFLHQDWVRVDYHVVREVAEDDRDPAVWKPQVAEYFGRIRSSPHYRDTVFLVHSGWRSINGNRAVGLRLLPDGSRVFLWRSVPDRLRLGTSFADGLSHPFSTLDECVNAAALLGWRRIVLVGVDLYDRRYFWLGPEETRSTDLRRGATYRDPHARAHTGMVENMGRWGEELGARGIELLVYNPRSLLSAVLPVYAAESIR